MGSGLGSIEGSESGSLTFSSTECCVCKRYAALREQSKM